MKATYHRYILDFKKPSGTSRGILTQKETWFLIISDGRKQGIGECGILRGLSADDLPNYEEKLKWLCCHIHSDPNELHQELTNYPSIQFGLEQALLSLQSDYPFHLFPSDFIHKESGISINGLVWMGNTDFMLKQIKQKLKAGFSCIKMKIGAIDFESEISLLKFIRRHFNKDDIELRVDANGAFDPKAALDRLKQLAELDIHSIEQPIKPNQWKLMTHLCANTPLPIALDEELIGVTDKTKRNELLQTIQPQYIILKPSLVGGFAESNHWISLAEKYGIGWWVTSALESNIGLNAIAQWTFTLQNAMPQGLGTGGLFANNFSAPLEVSQGSLFYRNKLSWHNDLIATLCT